MTTYKSRAEVPIEEKWNLDDLYLDISKWEEDLSAIETMANDLKNFDGAIKNGQDLFHFLKKQEELSYKFNHVFAYAMLSVDLDTRDTTSQSLLD